MNPEGKIAVIERETIEQEFSPYDDRYAALNDVTYAGSPVALVLVQRIDTLEMHEVQALVKWANDNSVPLLGTVRDDRRGRSPGDLRTPEPTYLFDLATEVYGLFGLENRLSPEFVMRCVKSRTRGELVCREKESTIRKSAHRDI